jgi:glycine hydroxymethyltransferase
MAEEFKQRGYNMVSGGTSNHLILLDLRSKGITGKLADHALGLADITVNKNMIPYDPQPPMTTSGIRVGAAAITTRGFQETECRQVVEWIDRVLCNPEDERTIKLVKREINQFMRSFPLYGKAYRVKKDQ